MTFFEWLAMLLSSGVLGAVASAVQQYLAERWPWLARRDKVEKVAVQITLTLLFVTTLYGLVLVLEIAPLPTDWRAVVNDIGTYALVALGSSQVRYQASKQGQGASSTLL